MAVKHARNKLLFGEEFEKLKEANVLLLGVGGVGSFCLDCLYRSGLENITIVDYDVYDVSNQNRQMHSELHEGESKVKALQSHYPNVTIIEQKIDEAWVESFDFEPYDVILDAIDDTWAKIALAQKCYKKLISATGSAKRMDPTKVEVATIYKTHGDKFASKLRYELKKRRFNKKYPVIFSSEPAQVKEKGSFVAVTGTFGLSMCSLTIDKILGKKWQR